MTVNNLLDHNWTKIFVCFRAAAAALFAKFPARNRWRSVSGWPTNLKLSISRRTPSSEKSWSKFNCSIWRRLGATTTLWVWLCEPKTHILSSDFDLPIWNLEAKYRAKLISRQNFSIASNAKVH